MKKKPIKSLDELVKENLKLAQEALALSRRTLAESKLVIEENGKRLEAILKKANESEARTQAQIKGHQNIKRKPLSKEEMAEIKAANIKDDIKLKKVVDAVETVYQDFQNLSYIEKAALLAHGLKSYKTPVENQCRSCDKYKTCPLVAQFSTIDRVHECLSLKMSKINAPFSAAKKGMRVWGESQEQYFETLCEFNDHHTKYDSGILGSVSSDKWSLKKDFNYKTNSISKAQYN